jgi:hypothetical protein
MARKTQRRRRRQQKKTRRQRRRQRRQQRGGSDDGFQGDANALAVKTIGGVPTLVRADTIVNDPNGLEHPAETPEEV